MGMGTEKPQSRTFSATIDLTESEKPPVFKARGSRFQVDIDPFLNVDLFQMSGPVFPAHGHAGFSAATYLFEDSTSSIRNRDSLGDRRIVEPGGLHWTVSGKGIVHEEIVEHVGRVGHGAQFFVRVPEAMETAAPYGAHFSASELPTVHCGARARVRVLAGRFDGACSPLLEPAGVQILDVIVASEQSVTLPVDAAHRGFAMTVAGQGFLALGNERCVMGPTGLAVFEAGEGSVNITAGPDGFHVLVGAGSPLRQPAFWVGGFCMSSEAEVQAAAQRFRSGQMHGRFSHP